MPRSRRSCRRTWTRPAARFPTPAWRTKLAWYLVATNDRMIPPPAQRAMANLIKRAALG
ncbi:hypothetical protein ACFWIA_34200 [Streptomyces sp. NPDC127068]|uniref:hypothetical protein n=1 Tax=Streptomyces sp. NPDC127068 TaxID=3347127 RepID=UPI00364E0C51